MQIVVQYWLRLIEIGTLLKNLGYVDPYVQNWPRGFAHEPTSQRIKPKPVPGKVRQAGSVPVNPGNVRNGEHGAEP